MILMPIGTVSLLFTLLFAILVKYIEWLALLYQFVLIKKLLVEG